ncbi:MAG: hypothetical protein B7Y80_20180 [Hyphomicrobium sp. 32-62-53]|nr:MAG: hypothetical protein B7Z29_20045 [Hyphomicrobium sp. 12-62-95]OYX97307.1 MAG: hypothetical protein B7Y80_20180 [Hyphomicrobium sp. 32-62-53]
MTSYVDLTRRPLLRRVAWRIITNRRINKALIPILEYLPPSDTVAKIPVVGRTAILTLSDGSTIKLLEPDRCHIAKELFWGRGKLHSAADRLALETAIALSAHADLFLDIGSYTGLFAIAVAQSNPKLLSYAYEIVPDNFLLLWRNVIANDLVARVAPQLIGLGDEKTEIRIPDSFGAGTLASSVALDAGENTGVKIPVERLDDQHASFSGRAVFKIDVETFEWQVLSGGQNFIARNRPDIICEVLRRATKIPEIQALLSEYGYRIFHCTSSGLRLSGSIVPTVAERDWLFTTRTPTELSALGISLAAQ